MQEKIRCIVLRTVKYGDSSMIIDTFTESHGRMSFMASVSRSGKSGGFAFWALLSQLEFEADIRKQGKLPKPKDTRFHFNYSDLPYNPLKSSIAMFIGEFLNAALKGESQNVPLYKYIETSLRWLDMAHSVEENGIANFHLVFLMHLTRFLGIYPNLDNHHNRYFDLLAGEYCDRQPAHSHFLRPDEACTLPLLFRMDYSTMHVYRFNRQQRQRCLEVLIEYYRIHIPQFPQLKSLEVLKELFT